ncbi:hypothetical protein [Streptomyces niveus]|uniref:hypothetical protein n=1 Tax=Streptomyces niveus TaxID=193462 RepID=UPI003424AE0F
MTDKEQSGPPLAGTNAGRAARNALLNAITKEVEKIDSSIRTDQRVSHVRQLAEAYALVVHGNPQSFK